MSISCTLDNLQESKLFSVLPGVKFENGIAMPDLKHFSCCQGSGMHLSIADNSVKRCEIKSRLSRVQQILIQLAHTWGPEYVFQLLKESISQDELHWLKILKSGKIEKGFFRVSQRASPGPSRFWLMALAAVWRFGYNVHIVTLGKIKFGKLLPAEDFYKDINIVLIENIDGLWKPEPLYDFETLISLCDQSVFPMFCEFKIGKMIDTDKSKPMNRRKSKFTEKIDKKKEQFPLIWLEKDMQSRFEMVCEKVNLKNYIEV